jgi:hypothetical protein
VARWREREHVEIPAWVFDPDFQAEADAWLDDLYVRDFDRWCEAIVTIISTPTITHPRTS